MMTARRLSLIGGVICLLPLLLSACVGGPTPIATATLVPSVSVGVTATPWPTSTSTAAQPSATPSPELTNTPSPGEKQPSETQKPPNTPTATSLPSQTGLDPAAWESWPIIPIISQNVRDIYQRGQALGNNPKAFSVFGDCQSAPGEFLSLYEADPAQLASLPPELQATLAYFSGSASHEGPTTKDSTTAGALLWPEWHENLYTCQSDETPMDCELRLNNPSFVLITVGTHYEVRNERYMRAIVEGLLERGVVPILATKADNREGDHAINLLIAQLASEYNIPLWNFWAATQDLPGQGLIVKAPNTHLGAIYFNEDAQSRFRLTALQALHAVWQAVTAP
jgi:hypothetical protein